MLRTHVNQDDHPDSERNHPEQNPGTVPTRPSPRHTCWATTLDTPLHPVMLRCTVDHRALFSSIPDTVTAPLLHCSCTVLFVPADKLVLIHRPPANARCSLGHELDGAPNHERSLILVGSPGTRHSFDSTSWLLWRARLARWARWAARLLMCCPLPRI